MRSFARVYTEQSECAQDDDGRDEGALRGHHLLLVCHSEAKPKNLLFLCYFNTEEFLEGIPSFYVFKKEF